VSRFWREFREEGNPNVEAVPMDPLNPGRVRHAAARLLVVALLTGSTYGCASDARTPAEPLVGGISATTQ
jgi:hypothetical protein